MAGRSHAGEHLERLLPGFLDGAEPDHEVGALDPDLDQPALELVGAFVEIGGAGIEVKPQPDDRGAGDPNVDMTRRRGSLGGSHLPIIAGQ